MDTENITLTTGAHLAGIQVGDRIRITSGTHEGGHVEYIVVDPRGWWSKLWDWLMRRPFPQGTSINIEPVPFFCADEFKTCSTQCEFCEALCAAPRSREEAHYGP